MREVRVIRVTSWEATKMLAGRLRHFLFRGHADASWSLTTKLERSAKTWGAPDWVLPSAEQNILFDFQRRAHHYLTDPPAREHHLEWLALVQHHGGPTRLLDVTRSFYAAAFFAMEDSSGTSCVWCLNRARFLELAADRYTLTDVEDSRPVQARALVGFCDRVISEPSVAPPAGVVPVEPLRMNRRLAAQQAGFLFPVDVRMGFLDNLLAMIGPQGANRGHLTDRQAEEFDPARPDMLSFQDTLLMKVLFDRNLHASAVLDLETMNVTSASLFPDLDGFARSLTGPLRVFDQLNPRLGAGDGS